MLLAFILGDERGFNILETLFLQVYLRALQGGGVTFHFLVGKLVPEICFLSRDQWHQSITSDAVEVTESFALCNFALFVISGTSV